MKRVLKAILTLSLIVATTITFAQPQSKKAPMTPEQATTAMVNKMATNLQLNDAQKKQVYSLMLERSKEREAMKTMSPEQKSAMAAKHAEKAKAFDAKIAKILTPEQYAKWKETQKAHAAKMKNGAAKACNCPDSSKCKASGEKCKNCTCQSGKCADSSKCKVAGEKCKSCTCQTCKCTDSSNCKSGACKTCNCADSSKCKAGGEKCKSSACPKKK